MKFFHAVCAACLIVGIACFRHWLFGHRVLYSVGFAMVLFGLIAAIAGMVVHSPEKKAGQFVPWLAVFLLLGFVYWIAGAPVSH